MKRFLLVLLTFFAFTSSHVRAMNDNATGNITGNPLTIKVKDRDGNKQTYIMSQELIIKIISFLFGEFNSQLSLRSNGKIIPQFALRSIRLTSKQLKEIIDQLLLVKKSFTGEEISNTFRQLTYYDQPELSAKSIIYKPNSEYIIEVFAHTPDLVNKLNNKEIITIGSDLLYNKKTKFEKLFVSNVKIISNNLDYNYKKNLLGFSCEKGCHKFVEDFINSSDFNKFADDNDNAAYINILFFSACHNNHEKIVQLFISTDKLCKKLTDKTLNKHFKDDCFFGNGKIIPIFIQNTYVINRLTNIKDIVIGILRREKYNIFELIFASQDLVEQLTLETICDTLKKMVLKESEQAYSILNQFSDKQINNIFTYACDNDYDEVVELCCEKKKEVIQLFLGTKDLEKALHEIQNKQIKKAMQNCFKDKDEGEDED